jgi:hypothetical protein
MFAAANCSAFLLFVVMISNAKFHALREPFIFQDFEYFTAALRHPRLYFPFLGWGRAVLAVAGFTLAISAGLALENPLTDQMPLVNFLAGLGLIVLVGAVLLRFGHQACPAVEWKPVADLTRLGLLASGWRYGWDECQPCPVNLAAGRFASVPNVTDAAVNRPDIVVVQSESFFDVRRYYSSIRPEVLAEFDRLKQSAYAHGVLQVPAWGANTVRTEFSFLAGVSAQDLGVHQFNPYRRIAGAATPTLVSYLKAIGYKTLCVHPYPASFYDRDKLFPLMGFDEFHDIEQFVGVDRTGPFVGDLALALKVRELIDAHHQQSDQPVFVFVITMENHGPLHLEQLAAGDTARFHASAPPPGCEDLTIYLRHLANADRMLSQLREHFEASSCEGWLCFYGDHVPILPKVYQALGVPDGDTDYLLWGNRVHGPAASATRMGVENLAGLFFDAACKRSQQRQ